MGPKVTTISSQTQKFEKPPTKVFLGLSSFQVLAMFRRGLFYSFLSIYLKEFLGLTVTQTSLFATIPMIFNVLFQNLVWGPLSDKTQRRRTFIVTGEFLAGIGTLIVWYAHYLTDNRITAGFVIIWGLSIVEIFWSMSNIGWSALISDIYPSDERSKFLGQITSLSGVGRIIGILIGGFVYNGFGTMYEGWGFREGGLFFYASAAMFISIFPMFFVPEGGIEKELSAENISIEGDSSSSSTKNSVSVKIFIVFIISLVFINFGINSLATIFPQYLSLDSGFDLKTTTLSYIFNTSSIATIIIGLTIGKISKAVGHGGTVLLGISIAITGMIIFISATDITYIYLGNFLMGSSYVLISSSTYAFASILIPSKHRGKLFGIYNATFFLSWGFAGTFISGPIIDFLGSEEVFSYQIAILLGVLIALIGLIIFSGLLVWQKRLNNPHRKIKKKK